MVLVDIKKNVSWIPTWNLHHRSCLEPVQALLASQENFVEDIHYVKVFIKMMDFMAMGFRMPCGIRIDKLLEY